MRILLVEDDPLLGDGLLTALKRDGHAVDWLTDGQQAAHALQGESFELILLDLSLPRRELMVLQVLMERQGRTVSREQLEQLLYGWDDAVGSNAVEVHIHHLRKRFGNELIRTVRGLGYTLDPDK